MVMWSRIQIPDHIPLPSPLRYLESRRFVSILIRSPASFHNTGKILLVCVSWTITGQPQNSVFIQSVAEISRHSFCLGTGFDNVGHRLVLATRTQISVCKSPFLSPGTTVSLFRAKTVKQRPLLPRSNSRCRIVGSHTRWELTTWADFQLWLHQLLMSTGCKSSHSGFLDVSRSDSGLRIYGWIGQLSFLTIFSTSLSVVAFLRRAGSSMLESAGSHRRGVERRVPEMSRMVDFNCTSTWLVWAERDQTGAQYSAA